MAIFRDFIREPVDEYKWHDELFDLVESAAKEDADFLALHGIRVLISRDEKSITFVGKNPSEKAKETSVGISPGCDSGLLILWHEGGGTTFDCYVGHQEALVAVVKLICETFKLPLRARAVREGPSI